MRTQNRAGFTLIELMVVMALTLFIMVILSQAFVLSLEVFAGMKGLGDMQINLRNATNFLRDDLSQDHFEGKRRLSDVNLAGSPMISQQLPQAGFFAVLQRSAASAVGPGYINEGADTNQLTSYRANDHVLYMTVKRRGNRQENFFTASGVPAGFFTQNSAYDVTPANLAYATLTPNAGFYSSQWAEVMYYLVRVGSTEEPNNPASTLGTPTFGLYRAQYVMVPDGTNVSGTVAAAVPVLSCGVNAGKVMFYSPADAAGYVVGQTPLVKRTTPLLTLFTPPAPPALPSPVTTTLVLPNVISFQAQVNFVPPPWNNTASYVPGNLVTSAGVTYLSIVGSTKIHPGVNAGWPSYWQAWSQTGVFTDLPSQTGVAAAPNLFDTAFLTAPSNIYANNAGLRAIQITLRVWDNKTRQTRQVTVVQDL